MPYYSKKRKIYTPYFLQTHLDFKLFFHVTVGIRILNTYLSCLTMLKYVHCTLHSQCKQHRKLFHVAIVKKIYSMTFIFKHIMQILNYKIRGLFLLKRKSVTTAMKSFP